MFTVLVPREVMSFSQPLFHSHTETVITTTVYKTSLIPHIHTDRYAHHLNSHFKVNHLLATCPCLFFFHPPSTFPENVPKMSRFINLNYLYHHHQHPISIILVESTSYRNTTVSIQSVLIILLFFFQFNLWSTAGPPKLTTDTGTLVHGQTVR